MRSLLFLLALSTPVFACPQPPPPVEVLANDKATIAPDGGLIVRVERGGGRGVTLPKLAREVITFDLSVLRPPAGATKIDVVRDGKPLRLPVVATPALAAPKLASVRSTERRDAPSKFAEPVSQPALELAVDTPATAYALVIYKIDGEGVRGVAYGLPTKRVFSYVTGGKRCYGGFEPIFAGERIAVAWLDVHGKLSARSATVTVGTKR